MSILRTIAMFIYLFGYMILHYGILRRAERAAAAGDTATVEQIVNQHIPRWSRGILKVTGVSLLVEGLENIPKDRPCVFVANHRSYYDIPLLLAGLEKPHGILAKEELEKIPLLNRWMKLLGCVFVQRDDVRASVRALNDATAIVEGGRSFVIFPEGTRYKGEEGGAGEFKAGAFRIAVKTGAPVVPVAVTGARALFEANGNRCRPGSVRIKIMSPIQTAGMSKAGAIVAVVGAAFDGHIGSLICFNSTLDGVHGEIVKRPAAAAQIACGDMATLLVIGAAVKHCGAREGVFGIEAAAVVPALCRLDGLPLSVDGHALGVADCNKVRTVVSIPTLIKGRFSGDVDDHIVVSVDHDSLFIGTVLCIGIAHGINVAIRFNEIIVDDDDVAAGQGTGRCHLSGGLCRRIGIFLCAHSAFKFCTSLQSKCAHRKDRCHHAACKYRTDEPCAKLLHKDNSSLVFSCMQAFFACPHVLNI